MDRRYPAWSSLGVGAPPGRALGGAVDSVAIPLAASSGVVLADRAAERVRLASDLRGFLEVAWSLLLRLTARLRRGSGGRGISSTGKSSGDFSMWFPNGEAHCAAECPSPVVGLYFEGRPERLGLERCFLVGAVGQVA